MNSNNKKLLTVTVAIPAHNEEKNIANLLGQVFCQKAENYFLQKILILLDGCTDDTKKILDSFIKLDERIMVLDDGKRLGKSARLNQIYRMNESEILITLDADIYLQDVQVFENLLAPLKKIEVDVVGANIKPFPGRTFLEKVVVAKDSWWYEARKNFKEGNNIYNSAGVCFAIKKEFAESLFFQRGAINDQEIIFLNCIKRHKKFYFADNAVVRIREASNWAELLKRIRRFEHKDLLDGYGFDFDVTALYSIPFSNKMKAILKNFPKDPFYVLSSIILAFVIKFISISKVENSSLSSGIWEVSQSTKELF